jgi:hypothetical protein
MRRRKTMSDAELCSKRDILDQIADELDEPIIVADGFDEALVGITEVWEKDGTKTHRAVYQREGCIAILMEDMSLDEAEEYFEYNVAGAYVEGGPLFITFIECEACFGLTDTGGKTLN